MRQNQFAVILLLACFSPCIYAFASSAQNANGAILPSNDALAARGFNELYNMDYDPAIRDLSKLEREHPNDPFTSNYLLAAELFK
jgi:hypothetical protein